MRNSLDVRAALEVRRPEEPRGWHGDFDVCFRLCVHRELDEPFSRGSQLSGEIGELVALPDSRKPDWGASVYSDRVHPELSPDGNYAVTSGIVVLGVNRKFKVKAWVPRWLTGSPFLSCRLACCML